jgi:hypothetical protein
VLFFRHQGYRQVLPNFELEGYGESHPLTLVIADRDHLLAVRSPCASLLPAEPEDHGSVQFFREHLSQHVIPAEVEAPR